LLATGAGAGFASALLGVGGGFIIAPASYWLILAMDVAPDIAIRIAFGTSLLAILPTTISGTWRHNKKGAVHRKTALILGPCALVGGVVGATLAAHLPGEILEICFGGLVLAVALWMGLGLMPRLRRADEEPRENLGLVAACGFPIGVVTGLTGTGGGTLIVPMLVLVLNFPMHLAIGTSVASIIFASLGGIVGYIVNGLEVSGPAPSFLRLCKFANMAMPGSYQHTPGPAWSPGSTCPAGETTKICLYCLHGLRRAKDDWCILTGHRVLSSRRHPKSST